MMELGRGKKTEERMKRGGQEEEIEENRKRREKEDDKQRWARREYRMIKLGRGRKTGDDKRETRGRDRGE